MMFSCWRIQENSLIRAFERKNEVVVMWQKVYKLAKGIPE